MRAAGSGSVSRKEPAVRFDGRKVIVCGGSRGIGRAIALAFAAAGAAVSTCARGAEGLRDVSVDLRKHGGKVHTAACDLADAAAIERYVAAAADALGGIDVLVNNASALAFGDSEEAWRRGIDVDLLAAVRATRAAQPFLVAAKGAIVNVSSIAGRRPAPHYPAYATVKAATIQLTVAQATSLAREGVRVNCVAPGSIEFPGGVWDEQKRVARDAYDRALASIPFGRLGAPEEVADVVLFLASPLARWVTGQTIAVDGGQLLGV